MKKIFLLIVAVLVFQNIGIMQTCNNFGASLSNVDYNWSESRSGVFSLTPLEMKINGSTNSYSSTDVPASITVTAYFGNECSRSNTYSNYDKSPGVHSIDGSISCAGASGQDDFDADVSYTLYYTILPVAPNSIIVSPSGAVNDGDQITLTVNPIVNGYTYDWMSENNLFFDPIREGGSSKVINISEGNNNLQSNKISVYSHIGQDASCEAADVTVNFYPKRPSINTVFGEAPSCNGGGDGKITISDVNGALGLGSGEGSVIAYKVSLAIVNPDNSLTYLPFNESDNKIKYITDPSQDLVFDETNVFGTDPLKAGRYRIAIENSYYVTDSNIFANGVTYKDVIIPPKTLLTASETNADITCNSFDDGEISVIASGGNPNYKIKLYNQSNSLVSTKYISSSGSSTSFSGLSNQTYKIQIVDKNNCPINTEATSNYITGIVIGEPVALIATRSGLTDVKCKGDASGDVSFDVSGGNLINGFYNYTLVDINTNTISSGQFSPTSLYIDNLSANDYILQIQDSNNCPVSYNPSSSFSISEPTKALTIDSLVATDFNGYAIRCFGESNGEITINASGGTGIIDYYYKDSDATVFSSITSPISNLTEGTYNIKIIDDNNCETESSKYLNQPGRLTLAVIDSSNYNGFDISCKGFNNGYVTLELTNGVIGYNYTCESIGYPNATINNLYAGDNYILVTDSNSCSIDTIINLTEPLTLPTIDNHIESDFNGYNISCNGFNDGSIELSASGGTITDGTYYFSIDGSNYFDDISLFETLFAGDYSLRIKDDNSCFSEIIPLTLNEPTTLTSSAIADTYGSNLFNISCFGFSDGIVHLTANGGVSTYKYFFDGSEDNKDISDLSAGIYHYYVSDLNNCISTDKTIELKQPEKLTFTIDTNIYFGNHAIRCNSLQDTLWINPAGGFGYEISGGYYFVYSNVVSKYLSNAGTNAIFDINALNSYDVYITDANNCSSDTNTYFFSEPTKMANEYILPIKTLCSYSEDGFLKVKWTGGTDISGYSYFLKDLNSNLFIDTLLNESDTAVFSNLNDINYRVLVADANNCLDSIEQLITSPSKVIIGDTLTEQPQCFGDTLGVLNIVSSFGGTPFQNNSYDYLLKNSLNQSLTQFNLSSARFEDLPLGYNYVFAIDSNNCISDSVPFYIVQPKEIVINTLVKSIGAYGSSDGAITANVTGGKPEYTYVWRDASDNILNLISTNKITDLPAGDYSVEVWDDTLCPYKNATVGLKKFVSVTEPTEKLSIYIANQQNVTYPGANNGSVTVGAEGGWNAKTYSINDGIFTPANIFTDLAVGNYTFYVSDGFSLDSIETSILEASPIIVDELLTSDETCFGMNNGNVSIAVSGGTKPYIYSIDGTNFQNENSFDDLKPGIYTLTIKDFYDNYINTNFEIFAANELFVSIVSTTSATCGDSNGSATALANGGTGTYTYYWETLNKYGTYVDDLSAGSYKVVVTDQNNCENYTYAFINNSDGPIIENITSSNVKCYSGSDGSATITSIIGNSPYEITWSNGQIGGYTASNLSKGIYSVQVKDKNSCLTSKEFQINEPTDLKFDFSTTDPSCYNGSNGKISVSLSGATTPYDILWTNIPGQFNTKDISNLCAGSYTLQITDNNDCVFENSIELTNPPQISVFSDNSETICQGQSLFLDAQNSGSTFLWSSDNGFVANSQEVEIFEQGNYFLSLITPLGCVVKDTFSLFKNDTYLVANFLMPDTAFVNDTIVLIEISWIKPDSVSWTIPNGLWIIDENEQNIQVVPVKTGLMTVGMNAYSGDCSDYTENYVYVLPNDYKANFTDKNSDSTNNNIKVVHMYPNPNNGKFTLEVELQETDDIYVDVYNFIGLKQTNTRKGTNQKKYYFDFELSNITEGIYLISIKTKKSGANVKFIKN